MSVRLPPSWLALGGLALMVLACSESGRRTAGAPATPDSTPTTVTVLAYGDETYPGYAGQFLAFSTLFEEDETGEIRGKLVRSWERDPETNAWTLHLRTDVRWHDGVRFTAGDVEFTLEYLKRQWQVPPGGGCPLEVVDDSTLTLPSDGRCGVWPSAYLDLNERYLDELEAEISQPNETLNQNAWRYREGLEEQIAETRAVISRLREQFRGRQ